MRKTRRRALWPKSSKACAIGQPQPRHPLPRPSSCSNHSLTSTEGLPQSRERTPLILTILATRVRRSRFRNSAICAPLSASSHRSRTMSVDTEKLIAELRAGLDGVTPGPWRMHVPDRGYCYNYLLTDAPEYEPNEKQPWRHPIADFDDCARGEVNAAFVALLHQIGR